MQSSGTKSHRRASSKSIFSRKDLGSKLVTSDKNADKQYYTKRYKPKQKPHVKTVDSILSKRSAEFSSDGSRKNPLKRNPVRRKKARKVSDTYSSDILLSSIVQDRKSFSFRKHKNDTVGVQKVHRKKRRKRKKESRDQDGAASLQRRARYLLIKMKMDQNLIDAYSGEGWNGQSREKIKPVKELQRATKQILKCKLGIRDAIHQLDLLSSEGSIEQSAFGPDGSVFHEHIFCATCKLQEAFLDNDIILCDGTCNRAFHQKCLEPPLATENIPPGDQGWFCKFCDCKMEILDAVNAHLGTHFSVNSNWQEIFKEEASRPNEEKTSLIPDDAWPSDESDDHDYDPERNDVSCSFSRTGSEDDEASSSSSFFWTSDEEAKLQPRNSEDDRSPNGGSYQGKDRGKSYGKNRSIDPDDSTGCEIMNQRRQRRDVDYQQLHDEMFGKDVIENEQVSEDEDWGPGRRRRRLNESDAAGTLVALCGTGDGCSNAMRVEAKMKPCSPLEDKRTLFRIPSHAVEKLRRVFAENELPSRAAKENLSEQLGIASEKVNKWFKNARYAALKNRKADSTGRHDNNGKTAKESPAAAENNQTPNAIVNSDTVPSANEVLIPKSLREVHLKNKSKALTNNQKKKRYKSTIGVWQTNSHELIGNDINYKKNLIDTRRKFPHENINHEEVISEKVEQQYCAEMERLCHLQAKLAEMKQVLMRIWKGKNHVNDQVVYVPVAELKIKR